MQGEQITIKEIIRGVQMEERMTPIIENQKTDELERHTKIEITKLRKIGKRAKEKGLRIGNKTIQMMHMVDLLQIIRALTRHTNLVTRMEHRHQTETKEKDRGVKMTIDLNTGILGTQNRTIELPKTTTNTKSKDKTGRVINKSHTIKPKILSTPRNNQLMTIINKDKDMKRREIIKTNEILEDITTLDRKYMD